MNKSKIFEKVNISSLEIKNRIVMPPMCMYKSDESGELKDFHKYHYIARALGGVGLIIVEATAIEPKGRISNNDLGLWDDSHIPNHRVLNEEIHKFGAKTSIQLAHAGRKSVCTNSIPVAPSSIEFSSNKPFKKPDELSLEEIENVKLKFLSSAKRAKEAGYDLIELHGAHGYLLCEFLSPLSNKRDDIYGGSLENRCKLILEIASLLKKEVDLPLIVRLSADEWMDEGWSLENSIYLSKKLEDVGVDAIHVSAGGNQEIVDKMPLLKPMYQASYAKKIKQNITIPVIAVGLITTVNEGEKLLEEEYCDFVAYGRELLRSPNLVFHMARELCEKENINSSYLRAF